MPALVPPEITMDPQWQTQIEKDLKVRDAILEVYYRGLILSRDAISNAEIVISRKRKIRRCRRTTRICKRG